MLIYTKATGLWKQMERITAPKMKEALKDWLPFYNADNNIKYLLQKMSALTKIFASVKLYFDSMRSKYMTTLSSILIKI